MENRTYHVVLTGIQEGSDPQSVAEKLATAFRSSTEKIQAMLSKLPVTVKSNVDRATAEKFRDVLTGCGAECRLKDMAANSLNPQVPNRTEGPLNDRVNSPMSSPSSKGTTPPGPRPVSKPARKRFKWVYYIGAAIAVIVLYGVSVNLYTSFQRKASMDQFNAYVDEYDRTPFSLTTRQETIQALDNLYKLYNAAVETAPDFDWAQLEAGEQSLGGSLYSYKDVNHIIDVLQLRKAYLLKSMRDASPDKDVFYGISLPDTYHKLKFFERCVIRKLMLRNPSNLRLENAFNSLVATGGNHVDCDAYSIGFLSVDE